MNPAKRILVIDPDQKLWTEYLSLFHKENFDIELCSGITGGVEKIKNSRFDCVIIDVFLNDIKGYQAVQLIKTIDPKVKIIMTCDRNSIELESKVREQDIVYYYIKSFDREELKLAVNDVFKNLGKLKEDRKVDQITKILIVDDDPDFVDSTRLILEKNKYHVEVAYNKNEAMEKIMRIKPDLILLDIMMNRLDDGFTLCYKLKHDFELKKIPIFVISSITEETGFKFSPKTDGEFFKPDDYTEKPIEADELLERVERLLDK